MPDHDVSDRSAQTSDFDTGRTQVACGKPALDQRAAGDFWWRALSQLAVDREGWVDGQTLVLHDGLLPQHMVAALLCGAQL